MVKDSVNYNRGEAMTKVNGRYHRGIRVVKIIFGADVMKAKELEE